MTDTGETKEKQPQDDAQTQGTTQTNTVEIVNGIACPIDPQALLECESCQ